MNTLIALLSDRNGSWKLAALLTQPAGRRILLLLLLFPILAATCFAQTPPPAPEPQTPAQLPQEKKPDDNPAEVAAEKTKDATVQLALATEKLGELALVKARDWEASWLTGVFIEKDQTRVPLTFPQRRELYLQQTFTTPGAYMKRMFSAGIDQARGIPYQWDDGWGGYSERFASAEGQFFAQNTLAFLGNSALHYEARYDACSCRGFLRRSRHAIVRNFVTYDESEHNIRPQWALYGGAYGGGLVSYTWKPQPRGLFAEGGRAVLTQAWAGAALNFFIEFAGDINRKIGARR